MRRLFCFAWEEIKKRLSQYKKSVSVRFFEIIMNLKIIQYSHK